jgi:hypothetical protein
MFQWDVFLQVLGNRGVTDRCPVCEQETEWGHGDHLAGLTLLDENRNVKPKGGSLLPPRSAGAPTSQTTSRLRSPSTVRSAPSGEFK